MPHTKKQTKTQSHGQTNGQEDSVGILEIDFGGTGTQTGNLAKELFEKYPIPTYYYRMSTDSDRDEESTADSQLSISLIPEQRDEIVATPERFGPAIVQLVRHMKPYLQNNDFMNGSKTTPPVTQLCMAFHMERFFRSCRSGIGRLVDQGATTIQPLFVGSTGGGCGSAGLRLASMMFHDETFRNRLIAGHSKNLLHTPIVLAISPFTYANQGNIRRSETKIFANDYACKRSLDRLLQSGATRRAIFFEPAEVSVE